MDIDVFKRFFKNTSVVKLICSNCESANMRIIGKNIAECQVCGACKAV